MQAARPTCGVAALEGSNPGGHPGQFPQAASRTGGSGPTEEGVLLRVEIDGRSPGVDGRVGSLEIVAPRIRLGIHTMTGPNARIGDSRAGECPSEPALPLGRARSLLQRGHI